MREIFSFLFFFFHMNFRMWIYYDFNSHQEKKIIRTCNTFKKYFFCHIIGDIFHERERWKRKLYSCIYINFFTSILKINTKKVPIWDEFCKHTGGWTINVSLLFWVKKKFLFIHSFCVCIIGTTKYDDEIKKIAMPFYSSYSFSLCQCHIFFRQKNLPTFLFMPMQCLLFVLLLYIYII